MAEKKIKNPFVSKEHEVHGQGNFDQYYIDQEICKRAVPVDGTDGEYIIEEYIKESKRKISDVVEVDRSSVGVDNIIRQVLRTGDTSLLPVDKGNGELVDFTNAPSSLMELKQMGVDAENKFKSLPKELVEGLDMTSFINSMNQEKFDAFIKAVNDRLTKENKKDE